MVSSPNTTRQSGAQRVAKHALARRESGLTQAAVWIPVAAREQLAAYARKLRAEAGVLLPSDPVPARPAKVPPKGPSKPKKKSKAQAAAAKPEPSKKQRRKESKERRRQRHKEQQRKNSSKKLEAQASTSKPKPSKKQEKPPKKRSPSKERRRQRRKAERAARAT